VPLSTIIPIVAFVVLALVFWGLLRRAGRLVATTRQADAFLHGVADVAGRVDRSLGALIERVDGVRRHQLDAPAIVENLAAARDAVARYAEEVEALVPPPGSTDRRDGIVAELERAGRAVEMVEHGCGLVAEAPGPANELEAQTAIKRGYLNLIHAREAIARLAGEVAAAQAPPPRALFGRSDHTM
jgi:hypothetical protein